MAVADRIEPIGERERGTRRGVGRRSRQSLLERAVGGAIETLGGDPLRVAQAEARRQLQGAIGLDTVWRLRRGYPWQAVGGAFEPLHS